MISILFVNCFALTKLKHTIFSSPVSRFRNCLNFKMIEVQFFFVVSSFLPGPLNL